MKPAVFPVPVWAIPTTSDPSRAAGIAFPWMGVGSVHPRASTAARTDSLRSRSSNLLVSSLKRSAPS